MLRTVSYFTAHVKCAAILHNGILEFFKTLPDAGIRFRVGEVVSISQNLTAFFAGLPKPVGNVPGCDCGIASGKDGDRKRLVIDPDERDVETESRLNH